MVDFDGNGNGNGNGNGHGDWDGILVSETAAYGDDWWASNGSDTFVKEGAPATGSGFGSEFHGTLDGWRSAFPDAIVLAFGFSLGSGVEGAGTLNAIEFNGTRYTFSQSVVLASKSECKNKGWATSTAPVFRNQGACVSSFALGK